MEAAVFVEIATFNTRIVGHVDIVLIDGPVTRTARRLAGIPLGSVAMAGNRRMAMHGALAKLERPIAITMWEQSWLQRRWPGAGYEDWDRALAELVERGYDAVRLEANPHNLVVDKDATWRFNPVTDNSDWASP